MYTFSYLQLLLLSLAFLADSGSLVDYGTIQPQSPVVEIGKNFSATCVLYEAASSTADDIYWTNNDNTEIPKEQYTKINESAVNVTLTITNDTKTWLFCKSRRLPSKIHGITLTKEYFPEKPTNLSCKAEQVGNNVSPYINCTWTLGRKTQDTLFIRISGVGDLYSDKPKGNGVINLSSFPNHMSLEIWVDRENKLGKVQSDHLEIEANELVKLSPPPGVKVIPEKEFPRSLRMEWKHPIHEAYFKLRYNIRFCVASTEEWLEVPQSDTENHMESFRLQDLKPDTEYAVQVRCIQLEGRYWSEWSKNATARTPEAKPTSKPDVWRVLVPVEGRNERRVQVICKAPLESNGKIREYSMRYQNENWETVAINSTDVDSASQERRITAFQSIDLTENVTAYFDVICHNSAGKSPVASLVIPQKNRALPHVEALDWYTQEGKLWVKWELGSMTKVNLSEFVVEWVSVSDGQMDWQRERRLTNRAVILGNLEKFKRYNISVYPVYSGMVGKPVTRVAFLEQGAPLEAPTMKVKTGRHEVQLEWSKIPLNKQRGFIMNYTIFYSANGNEHPKSVTVSPDTHSYTLKQLSSHSRYTVWIRASTVQGYINSPEISFITLKYAPGQIEGIVVGVCITFLFCVLLVLIVWFRYKSWIKKTFWPDVPNPSNSTIGTWSPDFPSKPNPPKEGTLADVSVMEVDVDTYDGKSLYEEEKTCLPLKKDKYLSEEHSSGIGGSSCMSSPRQSVSDSDEGSDSGQTTASTIQYSSVVAAASSGYKGQTPSLLPPSQAPAQQPTFARSESTQPLLDQEEHPDLPGQDGSLQTQRNPNNPYFRRWQGGSEDSRQPAADLSQLEMEWQGGLAMLRFSPLEETSQQTTPTEEGQSPDGQQAGLTSGHRPQLSGYRPQ